MFLFNRSFRIDISLLFVHWICAKHGLDHWQSDECLESISEVFRFALLSPGANSFAV